MKRLFLPLFLLLGLTISSFGQSTSHTAFRIRRTATLPATCNVGDVYFKTTATVGAYVCTATNTWTLLEAAGGGASLPVADTTSIVEGSSDATKEVRFEVDTLVPTGTVVVATVPSANFTMAGINIAQTFSALQMFQISDTNDSGITDIIKLAHDDGNNVLTNFGVGLLFLAPDDGAASVENQGRLATIWTDSTSGSEDSAFVVQLRTAGAVLAEKLRLTSTGNLQTDGATFATSLFVDENGSGSTPSLAVGVSNTGFFQGTSLGAGIGTTVAGSQQLWMVAGATWFTNSGAISAGIQHGGTNSGIFRVTASGSYNWSLNSEAHNTLDTGLARNAAKVVGFTDGSTGGGTFASVATTPAQITADQNNYNPGGSSYFQRWSTDASRNVTGLVFTAAQVAGQTHCICNVGTQNIVLIHDDGASSTAVNRFKFTGGTNVTITADDCVIVTYDATTQRWRRAQ